MLFSTALRVPSAQESFPSPPTMAMPQTDGPLPWSEFELIDSIFAPLSRGVPGAFDLKDDVAAIAPEPGHELVLKTDSTIENVHFLPADPPDTVARKALRRALSDLAAKGTTPAAYLLALALPATISRAWLEMFAHGLRADQAKFCIGLAGGETSKTAGVLTITVTAIGWVPCGRLLRRNGARPGDEVWVTGTVGDAAGGFGLLTNEPSPQDIAVRDYLVGRFRIPEPRVEFGLALGGIASATIDVSDGLLADLGHVADVSGVHIELVLGRVPISAQLHSLWGAEAGLRSVSAGDDYEIAFTAPPGASGEIAAVARQTGIPVTRIGRVLEDSAGISLRDASGRKICVERHGYRHF